MLACQTINCGAVKEGDIPAVVVILVNVQDFLALDTEDTVYSDVLAHMYHVYSYPQRRTRSGKRSRWRSRSGTDSHTQRECTRSSLEDTQGQVSKNRKATMKSDGAPPSVQENASTTCEGHRAPRLRTVERRCRREKLSVRGVQDSVPGLRTSAEDDNVILLCNLVHDEYAYLIWLARNWMGWRCDSESANGVGGRRVERGAVGDWPGRWFEAGESRCCSGGVVAGWRGRLV